MKHIFDKKHYTLRFEKGEQVVAGLQSFVREQAIVNAWVKGLGGLASAELGFYDLSAQEYHWKKFDEPLELTNLTVISPGRIMRLCCTCMRRFQTRISMHMADTSKRLRLEAP